jgi:hypothetical protein
MEILALYRENHTLYVTYNQVEKYKCKPYNVMVGYTHILTHTHTHIYIYIYVYITRTNCCTCTVNTS